MNIVEDTVMSEVEDTMMSDVEDEVLLLMSMLLYFTTWRPASRSTLLKEGLTTNSCGQG